ncbi:MAG: hypothetical protein ACYDBV_09460 [Nitrospiria bacterium]
MEKLILWIGLILVLTSGCSGSSSKSAQGASGVTPANMAGTWNFISAPFYSVSQNVPVSLTASTPLSGTITLNADQTAQVQWPFENCGICNPSLNGTPLIFSGNWTVTSQGSGTIQALGSLTPGSTTPEAVYISFQTSRDLNLFILTFALGSCNLPNLNNCTPGSGVTGTALRQ